MLETFIKICQENSGFVQSDRNMGHFTFLYITWYC